MKKMSVRYHLCPTAVHSTHEHILCRFGETKVVEPQALPADVSDPEDHAVGPHGQSLLALAELRTQVILETFGSPLTTEESTSPMLVGYPVNDMEDEPGEPTLNLNHSYHTTMEEVPVRLHCDKTLYIQ